MLGFGDRAVARETMLSSRRKQDSLESVGRSQQQEVLLLASCCWPVSAVISVMNHRWLGGIIREQRPRACWCSGGIQTRARLTASCQPGSPGCLEPPN